MPSCTDFFRDSKKIFIALSRKEKRGNRINHPIKKPALCAGFFLYLSQEHLLLLYLNFDDFFTVNFVDFYFYSL